MHDDDAPTAPAAQPGPVAPAAPAVQAGTARTANLLGATALAVTDVALAGAARTAGLSVSGASALVVLAGAARTAGLGVTELGRRVGLTQSAAARMVDSLTAAGHVERSPGPGRAVTVTVTGHGARTARELLAARDAPLADALSALDGAERDTLDRLLGTLLARLYGKAGDAERMCRLCDRACCVRDAVCPVGQAEREARAVPGADAARGPRGAPDA